MTIEQGTYSSIPKRPRPTSLNGEVVCITGRLENRTKESVEADLKRVGATRDKNCTQSTTLLIQCKDPNGGKNKRNYAEENLDRIYIMDEDPFMELLERELKEKLN